MDELDKKITSVFDGKVVRKDLLHRIKKGTNVPTFVLEFFLARFCATDDEEEIKALLEIPAPWGTAAAVPIGYPVRGGHGPISRRPLEKLAFGDTWGEPLFEESTS